MENKPIIDKNEDVIIERLKALCDRHGWILKENKEKIGQTVVRTIKKKPVDELEMKAMAIINKRDDKEAFFRFLARRPQDRQEILQKVVKNPKLLISDIEMSLLPEY